MRPGDLFGLSFSNLFRRKLRTILTMLGVTIGTTSIIMMVSLGLGMQKSMMDSYASMGSLTQITVNKSYDQGTRATKLDDKALARMAQIPNVKLVSPVLTFYPLQVTTGRYNLGAQFMGVRPEALTELGFDITVGRIYEKNTKTLEFIAGSARADMLYDPRSRGRSRGNTELDWLKARFTGTVTEQGGSNPDGTQQPPKKHTYKLQCVGYNVSDQYNQNSYSIYCDYDSLMEIIRDNKKVAKDYGIATDQYEQAWVFVDDMKYGADVSNVIKEMGFQSWTMSEYIQQAQEQMGVIQLVLGAIGGVSMLVAALMIANTMLMSIYERTREIGVMKVLGCRLSNIRFLFLSEAGLIGILGGAVGIGISLAGSGAMNKVPQMAQMGFSSFIPPWLMLVGMGFSAGVAVVSGMYPAHRATKLSALAAIRNDT